MQCGSCQGAQVIFLEMDNMNNSTVVQKLIDDKQQLETERTEIVDILQTLEWTPYIDEDGVTTGDVYCPVCGGNGEPGSKHNPPQHYCNCRLAQFIYGEDGHANISKELMPE